MNKQIFSQTLPLPIFYLEKSIKGLCHMLQTLVQEQLTWVREGKPLLFVGAPGSSKQATLPPVLVLISRLSWERQGLPQPPLSTELCSCFFVIKKSPGQKQRLVWAVLGLVVGLYVPGWWMKGYVMLPSSFSEPQLLSRTFIIWHRCSAL